MDFRGLQVYSVYGPRWKPGSKRTRVGTESTLSHRREDPVIVTKSVPSCKDMGQVLGTNGDDRSDNVVTLAQCSGTNGVRNFILFCLFFFFWREISTRQREGHLFSFKYQ